MPMMASTDITGANCRLACGNSGSRKRRNPYAPIFSKTAARTTLPAVGASTCASGSQVCSGHTGTLIANARAKAAASNVKRGAKFFSISVIAFNPALLSFIIIGGAEEIEGRVASDRVRAVSVEFLLGRLYQ